MPTSDDEIKRLQRIRDQQLAARKPSEKRDKYFKEYRARHPDRKPMTLKEILLVFNNKWRGLFIGILVGLLVWLVLSYLIDASWRDIAGLAAVAILGMVGVIIGASFDWRDDIRKF